MKNQKSMLFFHNLSTNTESLRSKYKYFQPIRTSASCLSWKAAFFLSVFLFLSLLSSKSSFSGYNEDYSSRFGGGVAPTDITQYASDLGIHWARLPFDVNANNYATIEVDQSVTTFQSKGVVAYGVINPASIGSQPFPTPAQYAQAVSRIVERYDGDGLNDMSGLTYPIKVWELVNEYSSNGMSMQYPSSFTQSNFIEMVRQGAEAVKAACSDCKVAYDPFTETDTRALLQSVSASSIDIISFHTYAPLDYPSDSSSNFYSPNFLSYLSGLGLNGKKIWVTEYAMYDHYGMNRQTNTIPGSQTDNARWFVQTTAWGFATGLFDKIIYTEMTPPPEAASDQVLNWMCLVDSSGSKRQIYFSFKKLASQIDGYDSVSPLSLGNNIYAYRFEKDTKNIYILWTKEGQSLQTINLTGLSGEQVTVTSSVPDTSGNFQSSTSNVSNGQISLSLTNTPVFVEDRRPSNAIAHGLSTNLSGIPQAGSSVSFTVDADSTTSGNKYFRFDLIPDYGTDSYDASNGYTTIQDFSTNSTCTHTFSQAGAYIIVAMVSDLQGLPSDPRPLIGQAVRIGETQGVQITGLSTNSSGIISAGSSATFTVNAVNTSSGNLFYRFDLIPDYGTGSYEPMNNYSMIQDFSTSNTCTASFQSKGEYILVAWASDMQGFPSGIKPLAGMNVRVQ